MTESGARIEFENWDDARRITRSIVASFVWVHIPTENIWRETIVRWFDGKSLGIEFVGAGRLQPPKRVLKND